MHRIFLYITAPSSVARAKVVVVTLGTALSASLAHSAEWSPSFLGCVFTDNVFSATDDIYPDRRNEKILEISSGKFEMAFAGIDLATHRAQLVGNQGSAPVVAYRGGYESVIFLERTPAGNTNLTTVFSPSNAGTVRAVTSRHIAEPLGGYMASQYIGTCVEHVGELPGTAE